MTSSETQRANEQRRIADIVNQTRVVEKQAGLQTIMAYVAVLTFGGGVIVAIAVSQAKEVVAPVATQSVINQTEISAIKGDINEIKADQKETLSMLKQLVNR